MQKVEKTRQHHCIHIWNARRKTVFMTFLAIYNNTASIGKLIFTRMLDLFHDIFHGFSHNCSKAFRSSRLQGFESINSEIFEQFNSFIQCIKPSACQMNQPHFCFYLQLFLNTWNEDKYDTFQQRLRVANAGS